MSKIKKIHAREVLDSRGNPTVEVELTTEKTVARAIVPSGASTGAHEAVELRDGDKSRYLGKGVLKAVSNVETILAPAIVGMDCEDQEAIDKKMIELDGTENKGKLGANAILGVSLSSLRASAQERDFFIFEYLNSEAKTLPVPMMNLVNGGQHADSGLDIQEFMVMPVGAATFKEALRMGAEVFHNLKNLLKSSGFSVAVGDEGGFAPKLGKNEEALDYLVKAIETAGYQLGRDVVLALDSAASEFFNKEKNVYEIRIDGKPENLTSSEMVNFYDVLTRKYPIVLIEDGLSEDDWSGWELMTKKMGEKIQIVGDDLLVTNVKRLEQAINSKAVNSILIKLNQIGTVTETIQAIKMAKAANFTSVISHRSGETEDTAIADLTVGMETGLIKTGSLCRSERICKYNQLLRIEERLGGKAVYRGMAR